MGGIETVWQWGKEAQTQSCVTKSTCVTSGALTACLPFPSSKHGPARQHPASLPAHGAAAATDGIGRQGAGSTDAAAAKLGQWTWWLGRWWPGVCLAASGW